jgi:hypothetical protein
VGTRVQALDRAPNGLGLQETAFTYETRWQAAGKYRWKTPVSLKLYQRFLSVRGAKIDYICEVASEADAIVPAIDMISHLPSMYNWTHQRVVDVLWLVKTCQRFRPVDPKGARARALFASFVRWLGDGRQCPTYAADDLQCQATFRRLEKGIEGILCGKSPQFSAEFPWRDYVPEETMSLNCGSLRPRPDLNEVFES